MAYDKKKSQENYNYYKKLGICVTCRKEDAEPYKTQCFECADKARNFYKKKSPEEKIIYKQKINQSKNRTRQKRKLNGICVDCGKRKTYNGGIRCIDCTLKHRKSANNKKPNKVPQAIRSALGLCLSCCAPLDNTEYTVCQKCHNNFSEAAKKMNANPTPAMLKVREEFVKRNREFRETLFYAPQFQKQADRAAIENYERMCKSYI